MTFSVFSSCDRDGAKHGQWPTESEASAALAAFLADERWTAVEALPDGAFVALLTDDESGPEWLFSVAPTDSTEDDATAFAFDAVTEAD